jgi:hypothetical protein
MLCRPSKTARAIQKIAWVFLQPVKKKKAKSQGKSLVKINERATKANAQIDSVRTKFATRNLNFDQMQNHTRIQIIMKQISRSGSHHRMFQDYETKALN